MKRRKREHAPRGARGVRAEVFNSSRIISCSIVDIIRVQGSGFRVQGSGLQRKMILLQNHFVQNELRQFVFIAMHFDLRYSLLLGVPSTAGFDIRYSAGDAGFGAGHPTASHLCYKRAESAGHLRVKKAKKKNISHHYFVSCRFLSTSSHFINN